jgi:sulfate adenylyltransferase (ADP) / ATP adenylyltransferase
MMTDFQPGTLWQRVVETSRLALRDGALRPIATSFQFLEDGGVRFLVRVVEHLRDKPLSEEATIATEGRPRNPFLPYDAALFVADAGGEHVCLLNKFNVVDHHLLIVSRDFVHQDCPLGVADFAVWWRCLNEYDSLGFYNGGARAGASQPHRHLQLVPLPLADSGPRIPLESLLDAQPGRSTGCQPVARTECEPELPSVSSRLPFRHAFVRLDRPLSDLARDAGEVLHRFYGELLDLTGIGASLQPDGRLHAAYNLLLTRQWMLLVPRRHERFAGMSLNALAFAGALLTRDRQELDALRESGPMAALSHVAGL